MLFKRVVITVFAASVLMAVCAACSPRAPASAAPVVTGEIPAQTSPIRFFRRAQSAPTMPDNAMVLEHIQARSGILIDVESVANEFFRERVDLIIAANEEIDGIDLIGYGDGRYTSLVELGAIIPLNDLLDAHGPNVKRVMADGMLNGTDRDGVIWAIPRAEPFPQGYVPNIRGDWLDVLGMEVPSSMEEIDAFLAAVQARDLAGNGQTVPFLPSGLTYGMSNFFPYYLRVNANYMTTGGFGQHSRYMDENGIIRPLIAHPDMVLVIEKFREWYALGYLPQDIHLLRTAQWTSMRDAATFGMGAGWFSDSNASLHNWNEANPDRPPARLELIRPLRNAPSGRSMWPSNPQYGVQVPFFRTGRNAIHLMRYIDWICSHPDNVLTVMFGIEGVHWHWNDNRTEAVRTLHGIQNYNTFHAPADFYWPGLMPLLTTTPDNPILLNQYRLYNYIRSWNASNFPFDAHIPYIFRDTEAEFITADGFTLIQETIERMVIGQMPVSEWESVRATYNRIEGDIFSQVWTDQYYEFIGRPRPR